MDYGAIIPLAAFFVAIQLTTRTNVNVLFSALVAALVPYLVALTVRYIIESGNGSPILSSLFSLSSVLSVLIQFIVSIYIFKRIRNEDGVASTLAWGVGGFILVVFAIPYLVGLIRI